MTRKKMIMPDYQFEWLVDQANEMGAETVSIFGYGEPLLDKTIVEKVKYCTDRSLETFITTNGSLLNVEMAFSLLNAGLSHIRFSVHGLFDQYEAVHRGLKFNTVSRHISNFKAIADLKYKCKVSISVIPMHDESIEQLKSVWKNYELEIWKPHNWGDGRRYRRITKKRKKTCGRVHSGPIQIQADGDVIPCCFLTNGELVLGNTYKRSIKGILNGKRYQDLRKKHESGDMRGLPCESCDQLNVGGSPLLYSTVDPDCHIGKTSSTKFKLKEK